MDDDLLKMYYILFNMLCWNINIKLIHDYWSLCQCQYLNSFRINVLVLSGILVRSFSMKINSCWIKISFCSNPESFHILADEIGMDDDLLKMYYILFNMLCWNITTQIIKVCCIDVYFFISQIFWKRVQLINSLKLYLSHSTCMFHYNDQSY
jgi:hypothetical protein